MDSLIQMQWTIAAIAGLIGIMIGIIIGVTALDHLGKCQFREKNKNKTKIAKLATKIINPRHNERIPTHYTNSEIRAPMLDDAGVITDEQNIFNAPVVNISKKGIAIISQYFLKIGLNVNIRSKSTTEKISFPFTPAEVKNVEVTSRGLRIGLQFIKPPKELESL